MRRATWADIRLSPAPRRYPRRTLSRRRRQVHWARPRPVQQPDQSELVGLDRQHRRERVPDRTLPGRGMQHVRAGRGAGRYGDYVQRHRAGIEHQLHVSRARRRRGREPEHLLQHRERHNLGDHIGPGGGVFDERRRRHHHHRPFGQRQQRHHCRRNVDGRRKVRQCALVQRHDELRRSGQRHLAAVDRQHDVKRVGELGGQSAGRRHDCGEVGQLLGVAAQNQPRHRPAHVRGSGHGERRGAVAAIQLDESGAQHLVSCGGSLQRDGQNVRHLCQRRAEQRIADRRGAGVADQLDGERQYRTADGWAITSTAS